MSDTQESRIGIDDVSNEISRIFFNTNNNQGGGRPAYSDTYGGGVGHRILKGQFVKEFLLETLKFHTLNGILVYFVLNNFLNKDNS